MNVSRNAGERIDNLQENIFYSSEAITLKSMLIMSPRCLSCSGFSVRLRGELGIEMTDRSALPIDDVEGRERCFVLFAVLGAVSRDNKMVGEAGRDFV